MPELLDEAYLQNVETIVHYPTALDEAAFRAACAFVQEQYGPQAQAALLLYVRR